MTTLQQKWTAAIEATENPLAPIILQEGYGAIDRIGKLFAGMSTEAKVMEISNRLLGDFPNEELDKLSATPDFIMTVSAILCQALVSYGQSLGKDETVQG